VTDDRQQKLNKMVAVTDAVSRFFVWWFGELAGCVPTVVRSFLRRRYAVLALTPSSEHVAFALYHGGVMRGLGRVRLNEVLDHPRALASLLRDVPLRDLEVVFNLPADQVLRRRVTLPLAAQGNLRDVLAFEMDRHTPFKAGEAVFDYRVVSTDAADMRLTVDLAVIPSARVEQAARIAESFGLVLDRIGAIDDPSPGGRYFNFLPQATSNGRPSTGKRLRFGLAALAVVMALVAAYLSLDKKLRTFAAYEAQLAESRAAALEADQMKNRLTDRAVLDRFLVDRRSSIPPATVVLAELTKRLPDDTWLVQLRWQGDTLAVAGFSPTAAGLIAALEGSPLLSEVRFGSPVTADPRSGRERFNISAVVAATLRE
jgi:general secretion pathway protein L